MNTNTARIVTECLPMDLRAGDLLHVRADGVLSTVTETRPHRGGTQIISFSDHADVCVCGGTDIVVFAAR